MTSGALCRIRPRRRKLDSHSNFKPDKAKSSEKIDGIAGTVNALVLAIHEMDEIVVTGGGSVVMV